MYMPVTSMVTATRPRSSADMPDSSFCTVMSSGASRVNVSPMLSSVWLRASPTSKATLRGTSFSVTLAFTLSLALMPSVGLAMSPVNST